MIRFFGRDNHDYDYDYGDESYADHAVDDPAAGYYVKVDVQRRFRVLPIVAATAAVAAISLAGYRLATDVTDGDRGGERLGAVTPAVSSDSSQAASAPPPTAAPTPAPVTAAASVETDPVDSTVGTTPPAPATTSAAPDPGATSTSVDDAVATTSQPMDEVTTLQTVPPVRDLIVRINGKLLATDGAGQIMLAAADRRGIIKIIGIQANPRLQQVEFSTWSDGSVDPLRLLQTIDGPVAQIGLVIHDRIIVTTGDESSVGQIEFSSQAGPVTVPLGEPQWLPASRAVMSAEGLVPEPLTYWAQSLITEAATMELVPQQFVPTPEALWTVIV